MSATRPSPLPSRPTLQTAGLATLPTQHSQAYNAPQVHCLLDSNSPDALEELLQQVGLSFWQSARDLRSDAAGFKRKSIAAVSPATAAVGVSNKRTEAKQARKTERAPTGKRSVQKSMLAVDGEDIDRDADYSDNELTQRDPINDFSLLTVWKLAFILKFVICHEH